MQGDDGYFNFTTPLTLSPSDTTLSFDVRFENIGADSTEIGGSFFSDYLVIVLYDANNFTGDSDLIFDLGIDSSLSGMTTYDLDVSSLVGHEFAFSFELSDENDGFNSRVYLDNVSFHSDVITNVPEPQVLALFGLGILSLFSTRSKRRCQGCRKIPD